MKFKKALCAVMAGVTALTSVVMTVPAAAEGQSYNGLEYEVNGSEITITKYTGSDSSVYIPDMIDGRKVVKIGKEAFSGNETIEHVRFPAYLEEIWDSAFKECSSLQEAVFPVSMTYIGWSAFQNCTGISDIVFGSAVKMSFTFIGCDNVEDISLYPSESYNYNDYHHTISFNCQNLSNVYYFGEAPNKGDSFTDMFPGWTTRDYYALKSDNEKIAEFDPKSTHSIVTFDPNSGTGGTKLYALKNQQVSEPVPPEKKDCEFVGWYTNPEGKGEPWDFVMDRVSSDMTLYAKYRPLQFSVTFDAQGGSCDVKQKDYSFGLAMGELPVPTRTNYQFIGWYSRADGNGDLYTNSTIMPRSDTKLYAASFMIYMGRSDGTYVAESLGAMLPYGFTADKYMK